jgi:hypothetical protein
LLSEVNRAGPVGADLYHTAFVDAVHVNGWPFGLGIGDFNGDGKLDLAANNSNSVTVLLGKGDGTFQTLQNYTERYSPCSIAVVISTEMAS